MNILILYAHPYSKSFNHAILTELDSTLRSHGHTTKIKDLYKMTFKCTLDAEDLSRIKKGDIPEDIKKEQADVLWANALVFIYPIWWMSRPAILQGWIDRVFLNGFAFTYEWGEKGLLKHAKALVIQTAGSGKEFFEKAGLDKTIELSMTEGTLKFCGIHHITYRVFYGVGSVSQEERERFLEEVRELGRTF